MDDSRKLNFRLEVFSETWRLLGHLKGWKPLTRPSPCSNRGATICARVRTSCGEQVSCLLKESRKECLRKRYKTASPAPDGTWTVALRIPWLSGTPTRGSPSLPAKKHGRQTAISSSNS